MGKKRALLVACNDYKDKSFKFLERPIDDMARIKSLLTNPYIAAFDTRYVTTYENPEARPLRIAISDLFSNSEPDDLLVFYFSGHGYLKDDDFFIAPTDSEKERISATGIGKRFFTDEIKRCRAANKILILDCCQSGNFVRPETMSNGEWIRTKAGGEQTMQLEASHREAEGEDYYVLMASGGDAYETSELPNSVFTYFLAEGLETGAAAHKTNLYIELNQMFEYAAQRIEKKYPSQKPAISKPLTTSSIVIAQNIKASEIELNLTVAEMKGKKIASSKLCIFNDFLSLGSVTEIETPTLYSPQTSDSIDLFITKKSKADKKESLAFVGTIKPDTESFECKIVIDAQQTGISVSVPEATEQPLESQKIPKFSTEIQALTPIHLKLILDGTMLQKELETQSEFINLVTSWITHDDYPFIFEAFVYGEHRYISTKNGRIAYSDLSLPQANYMDFALKKLLPTSQQEFTDFVNDIQPHVCFEKQDPCDALELALNEAAESGWNSPIRYLILIGNSPPHPMEDERVEFKLLDYASDEFQDIDWLGEVQAICQNDEETSAPQVNLRSYWVKPTNRLAPQTLQYAETVWKALSHDSEFHVLDLEEDKESFDEYAKLLYFSLEAAKTRILPDIVTIPLIEHI